MAYTAPGVYIRDNTTASYTANVVTPSSVGIFGMAAEKITATDTITMPLDSEAGEAQASEPFTYPNVSNVEVRTVPAGDLLEVGTDYTLAETVTQAGSYTTLTRVQSSEKLFAGDQVRVSYAHTPSDFYEVLRFTSAVDVAAMYGAALTETGEVNSPLTLAAQLAFENGAPSVILAAARAQTDEAANEALVKLNAQRDVAVVTTTFGTQQIARAISSAVTQASAAEMERRAVVGMDGVANTVTSDMIQSLATQLFNRRVAVVAPAEATRSLLVTDNVVRLGGQYIAAAVAGLAVGQALQIPLTRKVLNGFQTVADTYDRNTKNYLAASGVMVVEETQTGAFRIRHGVTTDNSNKNASEWSIVGCTDYIVQSVRTMLDLSGFIGSPITTSTIPSITGMVESLLTSAVYDEVIGSYDDMSVVQRASEPDVIDIRFSIGFLYPLNRIYVTISSSSLSGETTTTTN